MMDVVEEVVVVGRVKMSVKGAGLHVGCGWEQLTHGSVSVWVIEMVSRRVSRVSRVIPPSPYPPVRRGAEACVRASCRGPVAAAAWTVKTVE